MTAGLPAVIAPHAGTEIGTTSEPVAAPSLDLTAIARWSAADFATASAHAARKVGTASEHIAATLALLITIASRSFRGTSPLAHATAKILPFSKPDAALRIAQNALRLNFMNQGPRLLNFFERHDGGRVCTCRKKYYC